MVFKIRKKIEKKNKTQEENFPLKLPDLFLNNKLIKKQSSKRFFGNIVDEMLTWLPQIKYI